MTFNIDATGLLGIVLGSTVLGSFIMSLMNRAKTRAETSKTESDQRINEADFVTKKYKELLDMYEKVITELKGQGELLEAHNDKLESEIIRSKKEESICRTTLQEYKDRLDSQEIEMTELKEVVKQLKSSIK